jgi:hypothetical protein
MFVVIVPGSTKRLHTVQPLLHFLLLSGRYYKGDFHKSEKD